MRNYIKDTISIGQKFIRRGSVKKNASDFLNYSARIESLKEQLKIYGEDSEIYKAIDQIPKYNSKEFKINSLQRFFYLLAFARLTMNKFLIRNTETHRIKRYIVQTNLALNYIFKLIK